LLVALVFKRAFGHGADQQFKKFGVHGLMVMEKARGEGARPRP
jgi:hypothetical protein